MNVIKRSSLWLAVGLILLICVVRMTGITVFPPFIDETIHIHTGELILQNHAPFQDVVLGRQLTIWWIMLFQPAASNPMWVARIATLLAVLPGLAALLSVAHQAAGRWGLFLFGTFYLLSTYHMFFERLALADNVAGSAVALAIYFAYRLSRRIDLHDAVLTGVCLFAAFLAKSSAVPYFGVPIAAALALHPSTSRAIRERIRWLIVSLGTALLLTPIFVVAMRLHGYDVITNSLTLAVGRGSVDTAVVLSPQRILNNIAAAFSIFSTYFGALPLIVLLLVGTLALILRGKWYLALCLFGPVLVIWLNTAQETRYYVTAVTLMLLAAAIALALLTRRGLWLRWGVLALTAVWGLIYWLPMTAAGLNTPSALPLPPVDYAEYVTSDASGFGFTQVNDVLRNLQPRDVIGALSNCEGLRYSLPRSFSVTCPPIRPSGQDRVTLTALFQANRRQGVYVVLEDSPYVPTSAPGTLIATIDVGRPRLSIYDLKP